MNRVRQESTLRGYLGRLLQRANDRQQSRGHAVNIELKDIVRCWFSQQGKCALSGIKMTHSQSDACADRKVTNASLDRIDGHTDYTPGNIQLVCTIVNLMKNRFPQATFVRFCKLVTRTCTATTTTSY